MYSPTSLFIMCSDEKQLHPSISALTINPSNPCNMFLRREILDCEIQCTRGRISRHNLGNRQGQAERAGASNEPTPDSRSATAGVERVAKRRRNGREQTRDAQCEAETAPKRELAPKDL